MYDMKKMTYFEDDEPFQKEDYKRKNDSRRIL